MPVRILIYAADGGTAEAAARAAFGRIAELDAMLSDYRPDSELNRLSATSEQWVPVSSDLYAVLHLSLRVARASDGAFDPTIGPLTALWRETRKTKVLASTSALEEAKRRVSWRFIDLDEQRRAVRLTRAGMRLDLGGIAKGYILQEAFAELDRRGTPAALLEAGGDIVVGDRPPGRSGWQIDAPYGNTDFQTRASKLVRSALASSGPTAQFVEIQGVRYSHVIDPRSGRPLTRNHVTGVIAREGAIADALATAFGVLGPEGASRLTAAFPDVTLSRSSSSALSIRPATQKPLIGGLDHVPVAVSDLERAAETYRRLGFVLKPGTPHANGVRNLHAKFGDGTEIELITAPEGVDDLTRKYRAQLAKGDGPAFLALHALDPQAVTQMVPDDHPARKYIFFGQLNASPTDRPEHFQHPNTAESLVKVWLASNDFTAELDLFKRLRVPVRQEGSRTFIDVPAHFVRTGRSEIEMVRYAGAQLVPGRPIIGAQIRVRDFDKLVQVLKTGGIPTRVLSFGGRRSLSVAPQYACGWRLEFVERWLGG